MNVQAAKTINLLVYDDRHDILERIEELIERYGDGTIKVLESFYNVNGILEDIKEFRPDCILLDIGFQDYSKDYAGIEVIRSIKEHYPNVKIIMQSNFDDPSIILWAMREGADSYILKKNIGSRLLSAIEDTNNAYSSYLSPNVAYYYKNKVQTKDCLLEKAKVKYDLTDNEVVVLKWRFEGYTDIEIGSLLGRSKHTVNEHTKNAYKKLDVKNVVLALMLIYGDAFDD